MSYIDGFVIAVPTANKQKFIEHARHFDPLFIELGAMRVIEGWGHDVPDGKVTAFRRAVQATAEETVAFAWIEWPDKATRDAAMKKMVEDPRMDSSTPGNPPMPFDKWTVDPEFGPMMGDAISRGGRQEAGKGGASVPASATPSPALPPSPGRHGRTVNRHVCRRLDRIPAAPLERFISRQVHGATA